MAARSTYAADQLLRKNKLRHFTVRKVKGNGKSLNVGLTLTTSLHNREQVGAVACLEDGVLTELHIAT